MMSYEKYTQCYRNIYIIINLASVLSKPRNRIFEFMMIYLSKIFSGEYENFWCLSMWDSKRLKRLDICTLALLYSFVFEYLVYINCGLMYFNTHILKVKYQRVYLLHFKHNKNHFMKVYLVYIWLICTIFSKVNKYYNLC